MKKQTPEAPVGKMIEAMEVNRMYELDGNSSFKWAMIEHNEYGYCWIMGYKGICTTIYSTDAGNGIKYWTSEADAKKDLVRKICLND